MSACCFLCNFKTETSDTASFDVRTARTRTYSSPLLSLLQGVDENCDLLNEEDPKVCNNCYELLEELDTLNVRLKVVTERIRNYLDRKLDDMILPEICYEILPKLSNEELVCTACGLICEDGHSYEDHVKTHEDSNPFTCSHCNKSFTQKGSLTRHLRIHTGVKPFQCETCGKQYIHHSSFNIHRQAHRGKRNHKCNTCGSCFGSTSHLKRHQRVHTGERKYNCLVCHKTFAERYNLITHEKVHKSKV